MVVFRCVLIRSEVVFVSLLFMAAKPGHSVFASAFRALEINTSCEIVLSALFVTIRRREFSEIPALVL